MLGCISASSSSMLTSGMELMSKPGEATPGGLESPGTNAWAAANELEV